MKLKSGKLFSYCKKYLPLIFILLAGTGLRLLILFKHGDFWFDEMFSFAYSQKSWSDSLKLWIWETNPPLHLLTLKLWFLVFPATELFARLPSLLFGVSTLIPLFNLSRRIFNKKIAYLAAVILALNPYHIFISATARTYSLFILLTVLAVNYFFKVFLDKERSRKNKITLIVINTLLIYTHLTALAIFACQLIILIVKRTREGVINWLKLFLIPGGLWLLWALPSFASKINQDTVTHSWFLRINYGPGKIINNLGLLLTGPNSWIYTSIIFLIICVACGLTIYRQLKHGQLNFYLLSLLILIVLPLAGVAILGLWNIKFFVITMPWLIILSAYLLGQSKWKLYLLIPLMAILLYPGMAEIYRLLPLNKWSDVNTFIQQHYNPEKKQVLIYNNYLIKIIFDRYYSSPMPTLAYGTDQPTDEAIVRKNYILYQHDQAEIQSWVQQKKLIAYDELLLFQYDHIGIDLPTILTQAGWKVKGDVYKPHILSEPQLYIYAKN